MTGNNKKHPVKYNVIPRFPLSFFELGVVVNKCENIIMYRPILSKFVVFFQLINFFFIVFLYSLRDCSTKNL